MFDAKEAAIQEGLRLDPKCHEVLPEGDWLKAARKATERNSLILYRHRITGQFVLADVIFDPDVIQELECWPDHPQRLAVPIQWVIWRCEPREKVYQRIMNKMKEVSYRRRAVRGETEEQRRDAQKWLRRGGYDDLASRLEMQPFVGDTEGGESLEAAREDLARIAKVV
jgi:hypothetical protein